MAALGILDKLKLVLREQECPFFADEELMFYLAENGNDFNKTVYNCLIVKAENTELSISGMQSADTSKYFRRLAQKYKQNNTRVLTGG